MVRSGVGFEGVVLVLQKRGQQHREDVASLGAQGIEDRPVRTTANRR
jgi:hypothetical protein